jgi:hypothetical protein
VFGNYRPAILIWSSPSELDFVHGLFYQKQETLSITLVTKQSPWLLPIRENRQRTL